MPAPEAAATSPSSTTTSGPTRALEDASNLPEPDVLAGEIADDLRAALAEFEALENSLDSEGTPA